MGSANNKLIKKIENFLAEKRESNSSSADAIQSDLEQIDEIVSDLLSSKYEKDFEGEVPLDYLIINKCRHEPLIHAPVPLFQQNPEGFKRALESNQKYFEARLKRFFKNKE